MAKSKSSDTHPSPTQSAALELTENDLLSFLVAAANAGGLQEGEMWRGELYKQLNAQRPMTMGQFKYLLEEQRKAGKIAMRKVGHMTAYRLTGK